MTGFGANQLRMKRTSWVLLPGYIPLRLWPPLPPAAAVTVMTPDTADGKCSKSNQNARSLGIRTVPST